MTVSKILVTGGAGFIGSAVIRHIINSTSFEVMNLDCLTYAGNLESLTTVSSNSRYFFEMIDICDAESVERVFQMFQPDVVMHLAAESHVDRSIDSPHDFIQTNIVGTYVLLQAAKEYFNGLESSRQSIFKFHHISTDEVFGDLPHPDDFDCDASMPRFSEHTSYSPSSPYSASKASSDHLVRAWGKTYGLPVIVTNCSNNYGAFQFPEKLIPLIISNALEGRALPIYGEGQQIRDWLYVDDHAEALLLIVIRGVVGESYNIGGDNEKRNIEVVTLICELLDELSPTKDNGLHIESYKDLITFIPDRPGHDRRYAVDARKTRNELGWSPKETFESGLRKTLIWYLDNSKWCERVRSGEYRVANTGDKEL